jgi:hypothetical protein
MGELPIVSQFIVSTTLSKGEISTAFGATKALFLRRFLYLKKDTYLAICVSTIGKVDNEIHSDEISDFILRSSEEVMCVGRMIAVINGERFAASVLPDRLAIIRDGDQDAFISTSNTSTNPNRLSIKTILDPSSAEVLTSRKDGVRLYHDALNSNDLAFSFVNYFRVVENGFALKGSRLQKPLLEFLSSGEYALTEERWIELKGLRDTLSHAYKSGEETHSEDVLKHIEHMKHIAIDVLAHKADWHDRTSDRHPKEFWRARLSVSGGITLVQGTKMQLNLQLLEEVTGLPIHLEPEGLNRNYKRYYSIISKHGRCSYS